MEKTQGKILAFDDYFNADLEIKTEDVIYLDQDGNKKYLLQDIGNHLGIKKLYDKVSLACDNNDDLRAYLLLMMTGLPRTMYFKYKAKNIYQEPLSGMLLEMTIASKKYFARRTFNDYNQSMRKMDDIYGAYPIILHSLNMCSFENKKGVTYE